jgi:hypothetical protein
MWNPMVPIPPENHWSVSVADLDRQFLGSTLNRPNNRLLDRLDACRTDPRCRIDWHAESPCRETSKKANSSKGWQHSSVNSGFHFSMIGLILQRKFKPMRPEFDHDEEYLVAYYRQYRKHGSARNVAQDVATVAVGAAFFAMGYFKDDVTWSVIGFGLVVYLALRGLISGTRYNRIIAGIIEKYENASLAENKIANA